MGALLHQVCHRVCYSNSTDTVYWDIRSVYIRYIPILFLDLTVNITPTSTSSIIRIDAQATGGFANQGACNRLYLNFLLIAIQVVYSSRNAGSRNVGCYDGGVIYRTASQAGHTPESVYYSYFDSPSSTSQITYKSRNTQYAGGCKTII